ncbi:MAG: hypothetical protein E2O29_01530 [Deltaproteobacteria bacterium]|nr:MAG: hypothetical protein E2O29_01530 [Deltaproteobacteria bacterium]
MLVYGTEYNKANPDRHRRTQYKQRYGITLEDYNRMFKRQKGKCAICCIPESMIKKRLSVDHNHKTKKVRGLLCDRCNNGLGRFKDDAKLLRKAIRYLV